MPIVELNDSKNPILKIQYGESKNIIIMLIAIPPIGLYLLLNINPKLENNSMINALRLEKAIPVIITYINVIRSDIFSFKSFLNIKNIIPTCNPDTLSACITPNLLIYSLSSLSKELSLPNTIDVTKEAFLIPIFSVSLSLNFVLILDNLVKILFLSSLYFFISALELSILIANSPLKFQKEATNF